MARVLPFERGRSVLFGALKGKIQVKGDILTTEMETSIVHRAPLVTRDSRIRKSKLVPLAC